MKENKLLFMGANAQNEREKYDYYATEPRAADDLLSKEDFNNIWECACGEGHLSKRFIEDGYYYLLYSQCKRYEYHIG